MPSVSKETATYYAHVALKQLVCKLYRTPFPDYATIAAPLGYTSYKDTIHAPLFVTFNIVKFNDTGKIVGKELRGCIGNFGNLELPKYVKEYAVIAAMEDPRFPPMSKKELEKIKKGKYGLECSVTVLHSFEDITKSPFDWEVGVHGIRLKFEFKNRQYSSTFLPEVAKEQKWNQQETFDALISKAGVKGTFGSSQVDVVLVERYQGVKGKCILSDDE